MLLETLKITMHIFFLQGQHLSILGKCLKDVPNTFLNPKMIPFWKFVQIKLHNCFWKVKTP